MLELSIAWRYIRSKSRERAISVIGGFSLIGIILGVATLIIVTSVMNGFRQEFTERIIGFNGHITMQPLNPKLDYSSTKKDLLKNSEIKQVVPLIERQALISTNHNVGGTLVCGITQDDLMQKSLISENIEDGDLNTFVGEDVIVLGCSLADKMHVTIGDSVVIMVPKINETGFGPMPRKKTFRVVATFKSGMYEYDSTVSYIPLSMAQKLFMMGYSISALSIFTKNPMTIDDLMCFLVHRYETEFIVTNWKSNNSSFMKAVEVERNVMFLILTLITLVASFNIIACMIMLVKDKEKDIAILRTIGFRRNSIMKIFFLAGSFIGVTGTVLGGVVGLLFSMNIQKLQELIEKMFQTQVFSPEVYFLTHLPSIIMPTDVAITVFVSLFLSCIATLYPARRASRLNPTEILRYV